MSRLVREPDVREGITSTVYPRRAGNLVTPWIDGVPFYERLLGAVAATSGHSE